MAFFHFVQKQRIDRSLKYLLPLILMLFLKRCVEAFQ